MNIRLDNQDQLQKGKNWKHERFENNYIQRLMTTGYFTSNRCQETKQTQEPEYENSFHSKLFYGKSKMQICDDTEQKSFPSTDLVAWAYRVHEFFSRCHGNCHQENF